MHVNYAIERTNINQIVGIENTTNNQNDKRNAMGAKILDMLWKSTNVVLRNHNVRIALAFGIALVASSLLMDFPIFAEPLKNAPATQIFAEGLASVTGKLIQWAGYQVNVNQTSIMFSMDNGVYFDFGCLGYREIIWFATFMLIIYGPVKHKLWYIPIGFIMLQISNILRAFTIAVTNYHSPKSFDTVHAQGSLWYMYGTILILWILWLHAWNKKPTT